MIQWLEHPAIILASSQHLEKSATALEDVGDLQGAWADNPLLQVEPKASSQPLALLFWAKLPFLFSTLCLS